MALRLLQADPVFVRSIRISVVRLAASRVRLVRHRQSHPPPPTAAAAALVRTLGTQAVARLAVCYAPQEPRVTEARLLLLWTASGATQATRVSILSVSSLAGVWLKHLAARAPTVEPATPASCVVAA